MAKGLKSLNLEKVWTPCWAARQLPETVEVIKIRGRWWMILWADDAVAVPDPERWAYGNGELGESVELELWVPPVRVVAGLVRDIVTDLDKEAAEKEKEQAHESRRSDEHSDGAT